MLKENGRLAPADAKELANLNTLTYVCKVCGKREPHPKKVFGEVLKCSCGGELTLIHAVEDLD